MSPKAARSAIDNWQRVLQRQTSYLQKQQPVVDTYQQKIDAFNNSQSGIGAAPRAGMSEGGYTFLGGDPSNLIAGEKTNGRPMGKVSERSTGRVSFRWAMD